MALIKCPDCGKMFSEFAECCPQCGCPVEDAKAEQVIITSQERNSTRARRFEIEKDAPLSINRDRRMAVEGNFSKGNVDAGQASFSSQSSNIADSNNIRNSHESSPNQYNKIEHSNVSDGKGDQKERKPLSGIAIVIILIIILCVLGGGAVVLFLTKGFGHLDSKVQEEVFPEKIPQERTVYQYSVNKRNCFIVISKKSLSLKVYEGSNVDTTLVAVFPACLSKNKGQKYTAGDYKTPECSMENPFRIIQIVDASKWYYDFRDGRGPILAYGHWFLRLNSEFSGIGIMGSTNNEASIPGRESSGSVRLRDSDLDYLKEHYVFEGMKVIIKSEDEGLYEFEKKCK